MSVMFSKKHEKELPEDIKKNAGKGIIFLARVGYISKGIVYILAGILTLMATAGLEEGPKGTEGALVEVAQKPFGELMLWAIAAGLLGYVCWKTVQGIKDPDGSGSKMKGLARRSGNITSAIIHSFLIYKAVSLAIHSGSGSGKKQKILEVALSSGLGRWVIMLIGAGIIVYGLKEVFVAFKRDFTKMLKKSRMSHEELNMGRKSGRFGMAARGLLFCVVGYIGIVAAYHSKAGDLFGTDGALAFIYGQPYGQLLISFVAGGLISYGVFQVIKGKRREIKIQ